MIRVRFVRSEGARDLPVPSAASSGCAGFDLRAAVEGEVLLAPGARSLVPTGLSLEIPHGWEAQVRPRSGLALRHGIGIANAPGTIDSDYRGEVCVILINWGSEPFVVRRGDRIAQLVFARVEAVEWLEVEALAESGRGSGGFGSTGR
ncbi:MAG TPA: dUTP diphosphatase [Thermoanaerobaculia bacterium]|nr:dUTP diphosphatase [Thermoanaerobaculia bacterium]